MSETQLDATDFDLLFSGSSLAAAQLSPEGRFLQVNAAYCTFLGYTRAELAGRALPDVIHPDDREESERQFADLVAGRVDAIQARKRFVHRMGHTVWGELSASVLRDPSGRGHHVLTQVQDVSDYVRRAAELAENEERYRGLVEHAPVALATVRRDGVLLYANAAARRLFGASDDALVGTSVVDRILPELRDDVLAVFGADVESEVAPQDREVRMLKLDGTPMDVEFRAIQVQTEQSPGMLLQFSDVTELRTHEVEIARLNRLYAVLSRVNRAVVRLPHRDEMFRDVCRTLADAGAYRLAWIGMQDPRTDTLRPVAGWELDAGLLEPGACHEADRRMREGGAASVSLSIRESGEATGRLIVYADGIGEFAQQELELLREISDDLSFALDNLAREEQRREAEHDLRASEQRLTEAQHVGGVGDWAFDLRTGASFWSSEVYELLGRDPALGPPTTVVENALLYEPEDRERLLAGMQEVIATGEPKEGELRAVGTDGHPVDLLARAVPRRDASGTVVGLYGTIQDITALKRAERQTRESEQRLAFALQSANLGHWDKDLRTGASTRSPQHDRCYGYDEPPADWSRAIMLDHVVPEDRDRVAAALEAALHAENGYDEEFRVRWPDGSVHWLWAHGRYWFDEDGAPYRVGGLVMNIDERLRTREATYRLAAIVDSAQDAIFGIDLAGTVTSWNPAAERLFGLAAAEMIGQPISRLIPPGQAGEEMDLLGSAVDGEFGQHYETERLRGDGSRVDVALTISSITDADGHVIGVSGIVNDISERKERERELASLEEQLRQSQKMEAVGILAGGVAHDFNNLLTVILGYSDVALLRLPADAPAYAGVVEIRRAAEMAADLTRQLLAFSREQVLQPQELDVALVVRETSSLLQRLLGEDVVMSVVAGDSVRHAFADRSQVEQIVMNLAANARDAMPEDDGRLELEVVDVIVGPGDPAAAAGLSPGPYVRLSFTDNGHGMTPETMDRIFEPFFTTKEFGRGTGLGLSTVFGIVKQSKGHISVESSPGAGATFRVYLPVYDPTEAETDD